MVTRQEKLMVWGALPSTSFGVVTFKLQAADKNSLRPPPSPGVVVSSRQTACLGVGNSQPVELGPAVPCVPAATIGHWDAMDSDARILALGTGYLGTVPRTGGAVPYLGCRAAVWQSIYTWCSKSKQNPPCGIGRIPRRRRRHVYPRRWAMFLCLYGCAPCHWSEWVRCVRLLYHV